MQPALARRNLLNRPQRLGFLPTLWFWNDGERHRLALPIVLLLSVPITPLIFFVVMQYDLPVWLPAVVAAAWPYVIMGLVERHVRGELRRRSLRARDDRSADIRDGSPDLPVTWPASAPSLRRLSLAFAVFGALGTVLAVAVTLGSVAALWTALGSALLIGGARYSSRRLGQLRVAETDPPALSADHAALKLPANGSCTTESSSR